MRSLPTVAVDFETFYTTEYSLRKMPTHRYIEDSRFDAYLVAVHGDRDIKYVGHPKDFNWHSIAGFRWCAHNVGFEGLVVPRLQQMGVIPLDTNPAEWFDTADLAAYLRVQRNLKDASRILLGRTLDKGMRDKMRGKTWQEAVTKGLADRLTAYGGGDAEACYDLFIKYAHLWPDCEQELSRITRESGWRGMPLNVEAVRAGYALLADKVHQAEISIPWTADGEPPLSVEMARRQARKDGIHNMPASLAMTSDDANEWIEMYVDKFPWVQAIRDYRRINTMYQKVKSLNDGVRSDGTFPYSILYCGAGNTGRTSGGSDSSEGGKFNMLNMPKKPMFGVDVRPLFIAPPGHKLLIIDYAQVEARLLLWRVGDKDKLDRIRGGLNLYEAAAVDLLGIPNTKGLKKTDPTTYAMVKATVLGAGYSMGPPRFVVQAPILTGGDYRPTLPQAKDAIYGWRDSNPHAVAHWYRHQRNLLYSVRDKDESYDVVLGSGRVLSFYKPHLVMVEQFATKEPRAEIYCEQVRGKGDRHIYGGKVTENEIQATSRDLLRDGLIAITKELGLHVFFTLYDEFVICVPDDRIEEAKVAVPELLRRSSPWAAGVPLDFDVNVSQHYMK